MGRRTSNFQQGTGESGDDGDALPQGEIFEQGYVTPAPSPEAEAPEPEPQQEEEDDGGGGGLFGGVIGLAHKVGEIVTDPTSLIPGRGDHGGSGGGIGGAAAQSLEATAEREFQTFAERYPTPEELPRWMAEESIQSIQRNASGIANLVTNPSQLVHLAANPSLWDDAAKYMWNEFEKNPEDAAFDLGLGALAGAGAGAAGAGAARAFQSASRAGRFARKADDAARVASAVSRKADDVARAGRVVDDVSRAGRFADEAAQAGRSLDEITAAARRVAPEEAPRLGPIERLDARLNTMAQKRVARRSNWAPTNVARRIVGRDTKDLGYSWGQRKMTALGERVGGDSPSLLRQYVRSRLNRTDTMPEFPEGTNRGFQAYERARWRNEQLMRPVNKVRGTANVVEGAGEDLEQINETANILADPKGYMMEQVGRMFGSTPTDTRKSIYGDEDQTVVAAAPTRWQRPSSPMYDTAVDTPVSQAYGQTPYASGRGHRSY